MDNTIITISIMSCCIFVIIIIGIGLYMGFYSNETTNTPIISPVTTTTKTEKVLKKHFSNNIEHFENPPVIEEVIGIPMPAEMISAMKSRQSTWNYSDKQKVIENDLSKIVVS